MTRIFILAGWATGVVLGLLTTNRMQQIMVDADLNRPRRGYTAEEDEYRDKIEDEIRAGRAEGDSLEFTSELP